MHFGAQLAARSLGIAAGVALWTLTEYSAHRWSLHGPKTMTAVPIDVAAPHTRHHRRPLESSPGGRLAAMGGIAAVGYGAAGLGLPSSVAASWAMGYATYDITHWFAHHRPARTAWGAQLRERHDRHHRGAPNANYGVTVDWWDRVFGTVAVPARATDG